MILRTIHCERKTCKIRYTEEKENAGFPNWGMVQGFQNEKKEVFDIHLCPKCLKELIPWLKGEV